MGQASLSCRRKGAEPGSALSATARTPDPARLSPAAAKAASQASYAAAPAAAGAPHTSDGGQNYLPSSTQHLRT